MFKRLLTILAAVMLLALSVAACGDDGDGSSNNGGDTAAETQSGDTTAEDTATTDADVPDNLDEAIDQCKENVNQASQLSADTKGDLEEICEKAGSGNEEDIREAAVEVCKKIIDDTIPSGTPGREQALAGCDRAKQ